ncbi:MAG: sulfurtransferase-like selenium metabolism protein YedF [Treponema sp.]|jgi:selenium metabolism protein YedF|nr:sulfurtransferase-like selenium metabolism protein YedF [Treponema sp.]
MEIINVLGKPCPIPVIEAKKALRKAAPGEGVQVLVDNDISRQNLEKMARGLGYTSAFEIREDGNILVSIGAAVLPAAKTGADSAPAAVPAAEGGLVVAIGKNTMGTGNDELGAILIKGFIYSLTELDTPPETLLFFNSGVYLSTEGSNVIEDLKTLEKKGTIIASCGTCLDFYKRKDKLAVGSVTNMYAIASALAEAAKLINL